MKTTFSVNGSPYTIDSEKKLLRFLRDDLRLTSVKDGCSQGACGSCTVLADGKALKACTLLCGELNGKSITTVEGLSDYERRVYSYAFSKAGAVQCGFCIPGMVICAKALLDRNPDPDGKQIRHAIRNNICRCTGYAKIVKAVMLAAAVFRGAESMDEEACWKIGERVARVDAKDKITGKAKYPDDLYIEGMLFCIALRSAYPRARVLGIDRSKAYKVEGVEGIFTAEDIPGENKVGHLKRDWDTMIKTGDVTRYLGDVIALVVASTYEAAAKAAKLVKVSYEVLTPVRSVYEAMRNDAPHLHPEGNLLGETKLTRGDVDTALENSAHVITRHFSTPWTEHAFLEPEAALSVPQEDGSVKIYSADQGVYDTRRETAPMLGLPEEKVLVENCCVGGGFGGKEDVTVQHLSALAALLTGKPCKMKLTREESLLVHPKRHPMEMDFTLGCDKNGIIQAVDAKILADTGAYASLGIPVLQRACTHAGGPYGFENFRVNGKAYYTNNPPAGAFRGFGVTQSCFAIETLLNLMADEIGISHWEIRYRNAIRPGMVLPNGQIADESTALVETLLAVREKYENAENAGIACAMKNAGVGVGLPDTGRVRLDIGGGKVSVRCAGSCIGQGIGTVLKQIVCDTAGLPGELVEVEKADSFNAPDSGTTSGSRHTTISGEAARRAAALLKNELLKAGTLDKLNGREFYAEYLAQTDPFASLLPNPKSHIAYGYATQVCILDPKTHKVDKLIAAHHVGKAINPLSVEGQIEGGVLMGLGFAVREKYPLKDCAPVKNYAELGLFRADEAPEIEPLIIERPGFEAAYGAIGIGEITAIPTAAAVADAYYSLDRTERLSLPLSNTPYVNSSPERTDTKATALVADESARCIGCKECAKACAAAFFNSSRTWLAFLKIRETEGTGNQSGISGTIIRPVTCTQCGACAAVCPVGAISINSFGVYTIDIRMCVNCGKCRDACPHDLIIEDPIRKVSKKCLACGICAKACPMGVLSVVSPGKK